MSDSKPDSRGSSKINPDFIRAIPKTDLHVHLDGSLRISTLIELAQQGNVELPSYTTEGLKEHVFKHRYKDLTEYLQGFAYTCAVLQTRESLERVAFELAEDSIDEGVRYLELRFAPQLHANDDLSIADAVEAVAAGAQRAKNKHNASAGVRSGEDMPFEYGVIACAMRRFAKSMSPYYDKLLSVLDKAPRRQVYALASLELVRRLIELRDRTGLPIVGFDLAGEEAGYPAAYHSEAYHYAHSHFLKKTVHAGEAYGPESIFQAITECHANRIGHGTFLFSTSMLKDRSVENSERYVEQLVEYIASQRITMEVCPTSNLQTVPSIVSLADHPIREMLAHNLSISICTDNRLVSDTTVTRELQLVAEQVAITPHQFRSMIIAGFKGSFFPGSYNDKRDFVRLALRHYARIERKFASS